MRDYENSLGVETDLHDRVEALCWKHRRLEQVPKHVESVVDGFGYLVQEYWKPDPTTRTVDLTVCPYWVDKAAALAEMDSVWEWADTQIERIRRIVALACQELASHDVPAVRLDVPYCWRVFRLKHVCGLRARHVEESPAVYAVYSAPHFGRFVPLKPFDVENGLPRQVMPKVRGKGFRCKCGCNVFTEYERGRYRCNSCRACYEGE